MTSSPTRARGAPDGRRWTAWQGGRATTLRDWHRLIGGGDPTPSTIRMLDSGHFEGELRRCTLDGFVIDVLDVDAAPHIVERTAEHIAERAVDEHMVLFQFAGGSVFSQAGSTAAIRPGDVAVGSSVISYTWTFPEPARFMVLRVDRDRVTVPFSQLVKMVAMPVRSRTGIVAHVARFAEALADDPALFDGVAGQRLVEGLYAMCEGGFLVAKDDADASQATTRERVLTAARRRLQDPDLRLEDVAAASFLSCRQVQRVFEAEGTTFRRWIRTHRLEAVRRDLQHPASEAERLGVIAARWGFPDQAHFARSFREEYGETPSTYRTRARVIAATSPSGKSSTRRS